MSKTNVRYARPRAKRECSDAFADRMYREVTTGDPPITQETLRAIEPATATDGVTRRAALWTLAMPPVRMAELQKTDVGGAVAVAQVAVIARDYAKRLRVLADLMETASTRIDVALCAREDMQAIYAEAGRESSAEAADALR